MLYVPIAEEALCFCWHLPELCLSVLCLSRNAIPAVALVDTRFSRSQVQKIRHKGWVPDLSGLFCMWEEQNPVAMLSWLCCAGALMLLPLHLPALLTVCQQLWGGLWLKSQSEGWNNLWSEKLVDKSCVSIRTLIKVASKILYANLCKLVSFCLSPW